MKKRQKREQALDVEEEKIAGKSAKAVEKVVDAAKAPQDASLMQVEPGTPQGLAITLGKVVLVSESAVCAVCLCPKHGKILFSIKFLACAFRVALDHLFKNEVGGEDSERRTVHSLSLKSGRSFYCSIIQGHYKPSK